MIEHLRSNKGKEFMYILPIAKNTEYIICKVKIINIYNKHSEMLILEVIREETGNGIYNYIMDKNATIYGSNKYLYPITNKFSKS